MKALFVVLFVAAAQQQCDVGTMVQGKTAEGIREYFPDAEVMNVIPCVLSVETHVDNVSSKLISQVARAFFASPEAKQLTFGMELAGYNYFILGFTHHTIVFDRWRSRYYVFDSKQTAEFFQTAPNYCIQR